MKKKAKTGTKVKKKKSTAVAKKTSTKKTADKSAAKATKKASSAVKVGQLVPDFVIPSTSGQEFRLHEKRGKKIVLYFYPKDSTPGCTLEGHEFSERKPLFSNKNVEVYGVSRDSMKSHENFKSKQNFSVELLSDGEEVLCKMFDVIQLKNMYGKMVLGVERSTFLIDEEGRLVKEWRKVKAAGHAQEVLESI